MQHVSKSTGQVLLTAAQVRRRFGSISDMTLRRWLNNTKLKFHSPTSINGRRYWYEGELDAWERARVSAEKIA